MEKKKTSQEKAPECECPFGRIFRDLDRTIGRKSQFCEHLTRSRVEFLKAFRSLMDERIEDLEKKAKEGRGRKITRVEVEE